MPQQMPPAPLQHRPIPLWEAITCGVNVEVLDLYLLSHSCQAGKQIHVYGHRHVSTLSLTIESVDLEHQRCSRQGHAIGTESLIIFIASVGKLEEAVIFRTLNGSSLPLLL